MSADQVRIFTDDVERPYEMIGPVEAMSGALSIFSRKPSVRDVNVKLRVAADNLGADAVIHVEYARSGIKTWTWRGLTAKGSAVLLGPDSRV